MTSSFSSHRAQSFPARDVGFGTAYERLAIYRRILHWCDGAEPRNAAEGPLDGMAGLPGLHLLPLARRGIPVTVVLPSSDALGRVRLIYERAGLADRLETIESDELPPDRHFDWVLAFNALPMAEDWRAFLAGLARRADRLVLFVSHAWSYGTWIRRASRWASRSRKRELFDHSATRSRVLAGELSSIGRVEDTAWVDCPWWPDLFVDAGQTLGGSLGLRRRPSHVYSPETFPYASERLPADLAARLRRHPDFEDSRLAPLFAHHRAYLISVQRRGS